MVGVSVQQDTILIDMMCRSPIAHIDQRVGDRVSVECHASILYLEFEPFGDLMTVVRMGEGDCSKGEGHQLG